MGFIVQLGSANASDRKDVSEGGWCGGIRLLSDVMAMLKNEQTARMCVSVCVSVCCTYASSTHTVYAAESGGRADTQSLDRTPIVIRVPVPSKPPPKTRSC